MAEMSKLYGVALYDAAVEQGTLELCLEQAVRLERTIKGQIVENPQASEAEKMPHLQALFADVQIEPLGSFLELLMSKDRVDSLHAALVAFLKLGDGTRVEAHVVSAVALRGEQVEALERMLSRKIGKQVAVTVAVDPALIGGFYLSVDGYCVDSSVRRQLSDMKFQLDNQ